MMGVVDYGGVLVHGNFAKVLPEKPKNFDFESDAKWLEDYPLDWRETWGNTICSCRKIEVHYAPYYGFDYFHLDSCNLMRKLEAEPQIQNLFEIYLPRVTHYKDAVPADVEPGIYVRNRSSKCRVKVRVVDTRNLRLAL